MIDADDLQRDPGRSEMFYSVADPEFFRRRVNTQGGGASLSFWSFFFYQKLHELKEIGPRAVAKGRLSSYPLDPPILFIILRKYGILEFYQFWTQDHNSRTQARSYAGTMFRPTSGAPRYAL